MKTRHSRRRALLALLAGSLAALDAHADDKYPSRTVIKLVVPFGPGTTTDSVGRIVAQGLTKALGRTVIVENRSGAGGNIGSDFVARSAPDGYTILLGGASNYINMTLFQKVPYDVVKDFVPIGSPGKIPNLLVVSATSSIRTLKDLADKARTPGGVAFASAGTGTTGHLGGELLKAKLGGQMRHVPYREGSQALTDLMSGQVDFMLYHPLATMPFIKQGRLRAIAVSSSMRSASAPDVPTFDELGVAGMDLNGSLMLFVPAKTSPAVVERLRDALRDGVERNPQIRDSLFAQGVEPRPLKPEQLDAVVRDEVAHWGRVVKLSGASID